VLLIIRNITQAKTVAAEEVTYLRRMQKDEKLRRAVIEMGS
jgi:hypothetical protein